MSTKVFPDYDSPQPVKAAPPQAAPTKPTPVKRRGWISSYFAKPAKGQIPKSVVLATMFGIAGMGGMMGAWGLKETWFYFSAKGRAMEALVRATDQCQGGLDVTYRARLRSVLRVTDADTPQEINAHGIRVCMDQNMMKTQRLMAVYYPPKKILFLRDDGLPQSNEKRATKAFVDTNVPVAINDLMESWKLLEEPQDTIYASQVGTVNPRVEWWYARERKKETSQHNPTAPR